MIDPITSIQFQETKGAPRIRDVDLGRVLGMAKPENIRQTIAKYLKDGKLAGSDVVTQRVTGIPAGQSKESHPAFRRVTDEYWLTEEAALFVGGRSDAPNATKIMRMLIAAFEELRKQNGLVSRILEDYFLNAPAQLTERIFSGLIRALLKLRREKEVGNPAWGPMLASLVYSWALKAHGQQEHRRKLNPSPNGARVDYVWLTGEGTESCKRVIQTGMDFARACENWDDWKYRMELAFGTKVVQLQLTNPFAGPPNKLKGKRKRAA